MLPTAAAMLLLLATLKLPFIITVSEDVSAEFSGAPRVQSFSFAQWKGKWVVIGGRIAGYHGVGGGPADFLRSDANRAVWVVDTTVKPAQTYHVGLDMLPAYLAPLKDAWASTGQLYFQDGSALYICGGYGRDASGHWITFPLVSRIELPALIDAVMRGCFPKGSITFARTPIVQSAGGQLTKLQDGFFYLVMGHSFNGTYTSFEGQGERNSEAASQIYLNEIRKLKIEIGRQGQLQVALVERFCDEKEFHRRDLNVTQILTARGLGLAAYGGVFTPESQLSYSKPVYLFPGTRPVIDINFDQKMNTYTCATILLYDQVNRLMYTTFLGGISRYHWNNSTASFVENARIGSKTRGTYLDGMQWSDQISTIRTIMRAHNTETSETVQPGSLPGYVGTNAIFVPMEGVERANPNTDILAFEPLRGKKTLIGYLYGGIQAFPFQFPYDKAASPYNSGAVPTRPNELILKIYLDMTAEQR